MNVNLFLNLKKWLAKRKRTLLRKTEKQTENIILKWKDKGAIDEKHFKGRKTKKESEIISSRKVDRYERYRIELWKERNGNKEGQRSSKV